MSDKYGVDPVEGNFRMTSMSFVKNLNLKFDVIFIDGLHLIINAEKIV